MKRTLSLFFTFRQQQIYKRTLLQIAVPPTVVTKRKHSKNFQPQTPTSLGEHVFPESVQLRTARTSMNYFLLCLARSSATFALIVDVASAVGFRTLFGFKACRILNTAHAVPMAWPAASIPSLVAAAALSPYLHTIKVQCQRHLKMLDVRANLDQRTWICRRVIGQYL